MQKTKLWLIILDLLWAGAALAYDWTAIMHLPPWSWLFIIICPLYPLLLACSWALKPAETNLNGQRARDYLIAVATLASAAWGVLALLFYSLTMVTTGWSWNAFGQIAWVWIYAAQGWWLWQHLKFGTGPKMVAWLWLILVLTIQYHTWTWSYLDATDLSTTAWTIVYIVGVLTASILVYLNQYRSLRAGFGRKLN